VAVAGGEEAPAEDEQAPKVMLVKTADPSEELAVKHDRRASGTGEGKRGLSRGGGGPRQGLRNQLGKTLGQLDRAAVVDELPAIGSHHRVGVPHAEVDQVGVALRKEIGDPEQTVPVP
jgi:hypothetical protein